jgi:putative membrane protein insertion efficiency factor
MMRFLATIPVLLYQWVLRPIMPSGACVFEPSCSEYTLEAIKKHGAIKGWRLGIRRISRCHPWQKSHYDPVP